MVEHRTDNIQEVNQKVLMNSKGFMATQILFHNISRIA